MSKSYRKEVLKRLKQELDATADTKEIIRIGNTIAKLTKPKRPVGRPRMERPKVASSKNKTSALVAKWADRLSHAGPQGNRVFQSVICEVEERLKSRRIHLYPPTTENGVLLHEVMVEVTGELTPSEQAAFGARADELCTEPSTPLATLPERKRVVQSPTRRLGD